MLKDIFKKNFNIKKKKNEDRFPIQLKGNVVVIGEKDGEIFHYDEGDNIVTIWAKHANTHLLSGESFSTHGNSITEPNDDNETTTLFSTRSTKVDHHTIEKNIDGTLISDKQYLSNNDEYYSGGKYSYPTTPNMEKDELTDSDDGFIYPFFPTKILLGTGKEFTNWEEVENSGFGNSGLDDPISYRNPDNGGWDEDMFNTGIQNIENYYSGIWDEAGKRFTKARTVNDVYSGVLKGRNPEESDFAIEGAIKDATYRDISERDYKLVPIDGYYFARDDLRGLGRPSFIYTRRGRFYNPGSETQITMGVTEGTRDLETKITFTAVLPEQQDGSFYPHNGYTLKVAGLFCDARLLLKNTIPESFDFFPSDTSSGTDSINERVNYLKMPCGIMWCKRKIAPIYKSHNIKLTVQWSIYLP